jgi:hypothetical protein
MEDPATRTAANKIGVNWAALIFFSSNECPRKRGKTCDFKRKLRLRFEVPGT